MAATTVPDQAGYIDLVGILRAAKAATVAGVTVGQARVVLLSAQRAINQAIADAVALAPSWIGRLVGAESPPGDARRAKVAASIASYLTDIEGQDDSALWTDATGWSPRVVTQDAVDAATEANEMTQVVTVERTVYATLSSDLLNGLIAIAAAAAAAIVAGAKAAGQLVADVASPLVGIIPWYVWGIAAVVVAAPILVPLLSRR